MAYAFKRSIRSLKQVNLWGILAGFALLCCLGVVGYYGWMHLQVKRINDTIEEKNRELIDVKGELKIDKDDENYKRYQAAKLVMSKAGRMNRNENIEYLIELLDELAALDTTDNTVKLENFQISENSISLKGSVYAIKNMYREGGVIDRFESFDFVKLITIPYYQRGGSEGAINFVLDASIEQYEGYDGSL